MKRIHSMVAFAFLWSACSSSHPISNIENAKKYEPNDYLQVQTYWTKHISILKQLDTTLHAYATFFTPDFAAAYVALYAHMFSFVEKEKTVLANKLKTEWETSLPFVIGMATHDRTDNNLHSKDPTWRIFLSNDRNEQLLPISIEKEKKITPTHKEFFPYLDLFYNLYHVKFPKTLPDGSLFITPQTRFMKLHFTGPLGTDEMVWFFKEK